MDTIKNKGSIKCKSLSKVDLNCLYSNQFIKNSTKKKKDLKRDLDKFHKTLLTRITNLIFEKVIDTWTNILQLHLLVLLIPHILPSLNINYENKKKTLFFERILKISHWLLQTWNQCFWSLNSKWKRNRNHQMKLYTTNKPRILVSDTI